MNTDNVASIFFLNSLFKKCLSLGTVVDCVLFVCDVTNSLLKLNVLVYKTNIRTDQLTKDYIV